tara:strand:- start:30 stop:203 length:174 start_codon:yes stop_codon:yes gene_type:complete
MPPKPEVQEVDFRRCPDGRLHQLTYERNRTGEAGKVEYRCSSCPFETTKYELKKETD